MKKVLILIAVAVMLVSCGKTPEQKANALIKENMQKSLYHPESYDPAETVIDSAFSPVDDPVVHEKLLQLYLLNQQYSNLEGEIKYAKSSMLIWSAPYDAYERNQYNEEKERYENLLAQQEKLKEKAEKITKEFEELGKKWQKEGKKFIGFKVIHSYRAKNNAGNTLMGQNWYLMDKDFTKIITAYDMEGEEFQQLDALITQMRENAEQN